MAPAEVLRGPRREDQTAAELQHPEHLPHRDLGTRGEDVAELAQHDVERGVGIGEGLGVALEKVDLDAGGHCVVARAMEEVGGEVEPRHLGAAARCGEGDDAGPAADIEHALPRRHLRELHQLGCRHGTENGRRRERRPVFALARLEPGKGIGKRSRHRRLRRDAKG